MAAASALNQGIYNAPDVALHYASLSYLTASEKYLFQAYIQPGMAILDIGVGGGRTTPLLSSLASRYVGIDYANEMIRTCREKFPTLDFRTLDASDLGCFTNASFDAVVMAFNSIDYVLPESQRRRCLQECHRILKNGGLLIFSSHNPRAIFVKPAWNRERMAKIANDIGGGGLRAQCTASLLASMMTGYALARCAVRTVVKALRKIKTCAFWTGSGLWLDPSHGGLVTHTWTPNRCIEEVEAVGFQITKYLGDDFPQTSGEFVTDWYYYVLRKF